MARKILEIHELGDNLSYDWWTSSKIDKRFLVDLLRGIANNIEKEIQPPIRMPLIKIKRKTILLKTILPKPIKDITTLKNKEAQTLKVPYTPKQAKKFIYGGIK